MIEFSFLGGLVQFLEGHQCVNFQWTCSGKRLSPQELVLRCRRHLLFPLNTWPSCRTPAPAGCSSQAIGGPIPQMFLLFAFNHPFCPPSHGKIVWNLKPIENQLGQFCCVGVLQPVASEVAWWTLGYWTWLRATEFYDTCFFHRQN